MHKIIEEDVWSICSEPLPWDMLRNKRILITGAAGFLGSYIVYVLMECNRRYHLDILVYALCRNEKKARDRLGEFVDNNNLILLIQDVRDEIRVEIGFDIVIHAASLANRCAYEMKPYEVVETNVMAYDKLLKKMDEWRTSKLMMISSSAVYGTNTPYKVDEKFRSVVDFASYKNVYNVSKQMCEMMTDIMRAKKNFVIDVVRPFVVFGPGDKKSSHKVLTDFVGNYLMNENIQVASDGSAVRSFIYIKDAIAAMFYVLMLGEGQTYNICSEKNNLSIRQLAELVSKSFNKNLRVNIENKGIADSNITNSLIGTNWKLRSLGWRDETDIFTGLERTITWAMDNDFFCE